MSLFRSLYSISMVLIIFRTVTADVIYEESMKHILPMMGEIETQSTIYVKADKGKIESISKMKAPVPGMTQPQEMISTVITRLDKKLIWILNEDAKTYTEVNFSKTKELMEENYPEEEPGGVPFKVEVTRLEEKQKIEGYDCEKVRISINFEDEEEGKTYDYIADLWLAKEKGLLEEILDFKHKMEEFSSRDEGMMSGMVPGGMEVMAKYQEKLKDLKGFPIVSEITIQAEGKEEPVMNQQRRIKNIRRAKLKDSEFEIPEGFKKLESPFNPIKE